MLLLLLLSSTERVEVGMVLWAKIKHITDVIRFGFF